MRPADRQPPDTQDAQLLVTVELDLDVAATVAQHRGVSVAAVLTEILGDIECRLHDAVRFRLGVHRVRVSSPTACGGGGTTGGGEG